MRLRVLLPLLSVLVGALVSTSASARVPQGFVGMMADGPVFDARVNPAHQLDVMVASGVQSLRVVFNWADAEPYARQSDVPASQASVFVYGGNVPVSFRATDPIVALAAQRGLTILPVVLYTPTWDARSFPPTAADPRTPTALPRVDSAYASYLAALVARYGPHGSFWAQYPRIRRVPIRMWQIWNEPNGHYYWPIQPFAKSYVALLRVAHDAIKRADPGAKVVLAGMPNFVWKYLAQIYAVPGARKLFDVVAAHPFTTRPGGVLTILQKARAVMNRNGDRHKPIIASEVSWPSSLHQTSQHYGFETTPAGQASKLAALLPALGRDRSRLGLSAFYYNTWMGHEFAGAPSFQFAGLFGFTGAHVFTKPAYAAFRKAALTLEGCRVKAKVATGCLKP